MTPLSFFSRETRRDYALRSLTAWVTILVSLQVITVRSTGAQSAVQVPSGATHPCVQATVSGATVSTALGQCSAPTADAASIDHFEADLRDGSFDAHQTDLVPYDFSAIPLVRSYLSRSTPFENASLVDGQPRAFGLNTNRFFDDMPVKTKVIERDGAKSLQEVRSARGNTIRLAYDAGARVWKADDDRNNTARYIYGSDGMLHYAFNTSGMIRHYTYDGTLMTAVEDEHRDILVRNSYTDGHLSAQKYANGDVYKFAYTWLPGQDVAGSVVVTLPDHSTKVVLLAAPAPSSLSTQ